MKVLLKSLKELKYEYGIEKIMGDYYSIIDNGAVATDMINLLGKVVEARYNKKSDCYVVDDWYFILILLKVKLLMKKLDILLKGLVMVRNTLFLFDSTINIGSKTTPYTITIYYVYL